MIIDDYDGQMIFGNLVGLKITDICLTGEEKPQKTSPSTLVPTVDRTRARCVIGSHATVCSTAVALCTNENAKKEQRKQQFYTFTIETAI